jgi:hypothetical protein
MAKDIRKNRLKCQVQSCLGVLTVLGFFQSMGCKILERSSWKNQAYPGWPGKLQAKIEVKTGSGLIYPDGMEWGVKWLKRPSKSAALKISEKRSPCILFSL